MEKNNTTFRYSYPWNYTYEQELLGFPSNHFIENNLKV